MIETSRLELKRAFTEEIKKELVAFANTDGGELIIGLADDGTVVGVENPDQVSAQVTNMLRDAISPDITLISRVEIKFQDNKALVHVTVNRGGKRPYYIAKKGMTSAGVYVRQGNTSAPASADAIREMIRETDGYSYESNLSFDQKLTFEYCSKVFADRGVLFGKNQMKTMKMFNLDGNYTNLAMLLSDQCFHSIQFACFQGTDIGTFTERQRFTGSILKQLDDAFHALNRYNRTRSEIHGLHRIDSRDYPEEALREALINAIVHRDYDRDVSTNIRVFDDRIEIVSFGGLPPNTTIETFLLGLSMPRNKNLADIFYRLELIEAFGSGIPKMTDIYQESGQEISFKTSPSGFMIVLPNLNFSKESKTARPEQTALQDEVSSLEDQRSKLAVDLIQAKGPVSRMELEMVWGISRSTATKWIDQLVNTGVILRVGHGRNTKYTLAN
ncbi:MAG: AAA family ATPase [Chloroflexi bacterium]|nr:AAA family ATPase [Chloroflexota bacterium]